MPACSVCRRLAWTHHEKHETTNHERHEKDSALLFRVFRAFRVFLAFRGRATPTRRVVAFSLESQTRRKTELAPRLVVVERLRLTERRAVVTARALDRHARERVAPLHGA